MGVVIADFGCPGDAHDFVAVREGYRRGDPIGFGPTETSAVRALVSCEDAIEQLREMAA